jgi:hypothetical protein
MTTTVDTTSLSRALSPSQLDGKLAAYLAASGVVGTFLATEANAAVVANNSVQPFGINGEINIDFNKDGQTDFQIEQNRVNLNGNNLDFLQIDKNDVNNAANPLPVDGTVSFPTNGTAPNNTADSAYVTAGKSNPADLGLYPSALTKGTSIGSASFFDFQEGDNFNGTGKYIRTNRLIDEDAGKIDTNAGFSVVSPLPGSPNFLGLGGAVRYLGVKVDFNGTGAINYGWIGIQITNEADATGNVVGWGYQTTAGQAIAAGAPEPSSILMSAIGGGFLTGGLLMRKLFAYLKG